MRETEARKAELERQHAEAQNQLREKIAGRYQGPESVEALQSKIRELEKKTELQMVRHEELSLELTSLRRARSRGPMVMGHSAVPTTWPPTGSEIDRIIAKIEQDNRCVFSLCIRTLPTFLFRNRCFNTSLLNDRYVLCPSLFRNVARFYIHIYIY